MDRGITLGELQRHKPICRVCIQLTFTLLATCALIVPVCGCSREQSNSGTKVGAPRSGEVVSDGTNGGDSREVLSKLQERSRNLMVQIGMQEKQARDHEKEAESSARLKLFEAEAAFRTLAQKCRDRKRSLEEELTVVQHRIEGLPR